MRKALIIYVFLAALLLAVPLGFSASCISDADYNAILQVVDNNTTKADLLVQVLCNIHDELNAEIQQNVQTLRARDEGILTAAKQYADQKELNANHYTDEKYNDLLTRYNQLYARQNGMLQEVNAELNNQRADLLKTMDSKDANTLKEAKKYTDQTASSLKYDLNNAVAQMKELVQEDKNYVASIIKATLEGYASKAYVDERISNFGKKVQELEEFKAGAVTKLLAYDDLKKQYTDLAEKIDDMEDEIAKIDARTKRNPWAAWAMLIGLVVAIGGAYWYQSQNKLKKWSQKIPVASRAATLTPDALNEEEEEGPADGRKGKNNRKTP